MHYEKCCHVLKSLSGNGSGSSVSVLHVREWMEMALWDSHGSPCPDSPRDPLGWSWGCGAMQSLAYRTHPGSVGQVPGVTLGCSPCDQGRLPIPNRLWQDLAESVPGSWAPFQWSLCTEQGAVCIPGSGTTDACSKDVNPTLDPALPALLSSEAQPLPPTQEKLTPQPRDCLARRQWWGLRLAAL